MTFLQVCHFLILVCVCVSMIWVTEKHELCIMLIDKHGTSRQFRSAGMKMQWKMCIRVTRAHFTLVSLVMATAGGERLERLNELTSGKEILNDISYLNTQRLLEPVLSRTEPFFLAPPHEKVDVYVADRTHTGFRNKIQQRSPDKYAGRPSTPPAFRLTSTSGSAELDWWTSTFIIPVRPDLSGSE